MMTTMKIVRRKKRSRRVTARRCDIMFMSNETEVVVSELKASGCDKLFVYRVEGRASSRRVEGVMNCLQVYHPALRDDGVDRYVCIPESVLRARECSEIRTVDKNRGPNKSRAGYAPTKEKLRTITIMMTTIMRPWKTQIWTPRLPEGRRGI